MTIVYKKQEIVEEVREVIRNNSNLLVHLISKNGNSGLGKIKKTLEKENIPYTVGGKSLYVYGIKNNLYEINVDEIGLVD